MSKGLFRTICELDTSGFATAAHLYLGLDYNLATDFLGGRSGLFWGAGHPTFGNRHAHAGEQRLPLVFEQIHWTPFNAPKCGR